jgi:MFS family permease
MVKITIQHFLSFLLVSLGLMPTICIGFVPLINIFEGYGFTTAYLLIYWSTFGVACIALGFLIDKVKSKDKLCFSYVIWGLLVIGLIYVIPNLTLILVIVVLTAIVTAANAIIAASYISYHTEINHRGFYTAFYLGLSWLVIAGSAYISFLNLFANLAILAALSIGVGLISFFLFNSKRAELTWEQQMVIPRDYNVKRNGFVFYFSTLVFGVFLGIIVYLLGTWGTFSDWSSSIYLRNIPIYHELAEMLGFGTISTRLYLANFDFLGIGAIAAVLSPIIGKLMDKVGRKPIFFLANLAIPTVLVLFAWWNFNFLLFLSIVLYAIIVTVFVVINCNVWSDLASEKKIAQFNGYGWSSLGLGGAGGFLLGIFVTSGLVEIDLLVIVAILIVSELSLIPFVLMKESLPPSEELEWRNDLIHLFVISSGGVVMSDYSFLDHSKSGTMDSADLLAGGISGITVILKEMVGSDHQLKSIDHEDKKILFEYAYGNQFMVALLAKKNLNILRTKLKKLTAQIQAVFWETIARWDGNLEILTPIKTLIRKYFEEF